jgi:hypothetical protein
MAVEHSCSAARCCEIVTEETGQASSARRSGTCPRYARRRRIEMVVRLFPGRVFASGGCDEVVPLDELAPQGAALPSYAQGEY